ncbi:cystine transport system permease protein [Deinobacterium chartae]|uniref:Cystine transport system permease protein n=1 Tax=Deinobacterium chartae TaxID=521158 RepID=A0A841HYK5_9DEIO|nr:amino acid ABC transporter permease [Deinobacterium chartae]MBB6098631.1 cystine transport system permease protein [Deinobacterium chartae]
MQAVLESLPLMLRGAGVTLGFALAAMVLGLILGFLTALARISKLRALQGLARTYVSAIRGTPLLVQIFVIYYGLPSIGVRLDAITAGIIALSVNVGAYISESIRSAILSLDKGQWEAAYSLGMTTPQALRRIVVPQALRVALPTIANSYISLIKDTSLVSVIAVTELLLSTRQAIARTLDPLPLYLAAAAIYWVLSTVFATLQDRLEARLERGR